MRRTEVRARGRSARWDSLLMLRAAQRVQ